MFEFLEKQLDTFWNQIVQDACPETVHKDDYKNQMLIWSECLFKKRRHKYTLEVPGQIF